MPGRLSNKDRIAKAAAEAEAGKKAKAKKKVAKKKKAAKKKTSARRKASASKSAGRLKLVWLVCDHSGSGVKEFAFNEEKLARKEAKRLSEDKGKVHFVKKDKVPLEADK